MKKVLLVGSNPSEASPDTTAFHPNTRSRNILESWFSNIDADISFINICDKKTPKNRPLRVSEIRESIPSLLNKIKPHPSGINRF